MGRVELGKGGGVLGLVGVGLNEEWRWRGWRHVLIVWKVLVWVWVWGWRNDREGWGDSAGWRKPFEQVIAIASKVTM